MNDNVWRQIRRKGMDCGLTSGHSSPSVSGILPRAQAEYSDVDWDPPSPAGIMAADRTRPARHPQQRAKHQRQRTLGANSGRMATAGRLAG
ncbi:hypothetical protein KCP71_11610 [Salmonella enterica subsp. enterica]|nr:hypothetical protein KCP71_11610 [Salmonella enterica subsp. enterica]